METHAPPAAGDRDRYGAVLVHRSARGHTVAAAAALRAPAGRLPRERGLPS